MWRAVQTNNSSLIEYGAWKRSGKSTNNILHVQTNNSSATSVLGPVVQGLAYSLIRGLTVSDGEIRQIDDSVIVL